MNVMDQLITKIAQAARAKTPAHAKGKRNNNPTSSADLIRKHSQARVIVSSGARLLGHSPQGIPMFSKPLTGASVRERMAKAR